MACVRYHGQQLVHECTPHGTAGYPVPVASAADTRMVMRHFDTGLTVDRCDCSPEDAQRLPDAHAPRGKKQNIGMNGEWCPRGQIVLLPLRQ